MHGSFDKEPQDEQSNYRSFSIKLIALPMLVIIALVVSGLFGPVIRAAVKCTAGNC